MDGLKDVFTVGCAVLGAGLGIINTWNGLQQRKVRLRVVPKFATPVTNTGEFMQQMGCIDVTNLSTFPVTVYDVGFTIGGDPRKHKRAAIIRPIMYDGGAWPRRLESRASVTIYFKLDCISPEIKKAYARTDCGEVAYGTSPALQSMRDGATG